jgi:hypothetical protein
MLLLSAPPFTASNGQPSNKLLFGNDILTCSLDENSLDFINCIANVYVYLYHPIIPDRTIKQIFSPSNKLTNDLIHLFVFDTQVLYGGDLVMSQCILCEAQIMC